MAHASQNDHDESTAYRGHVLDNKPFDADGWLSAVCTMYGHERFVAFALGRDRQFLNTLDEQDGFLSMLREAHQQLRLAGAQETHIADGQLSLELGREPRIRKMVNGIPASAEFFEWERDGVRHTEFISDELRTLIDAQQAALAQMADTQRERDDALENLRVAQVRAGERKAEIDQLIQRVGTLTVDNTRMLDMTGRQARANNNLQEQINYMRTAVVYANMALDEVGMDMGSVARKRLREALNIIR